MGTYLAVVFSDLERHSQVWRRAPRDKMVAAISEYRYLAESLASQYGALHRNFTGDGHLFLFESIDAAVQFGLKLIEAWSAVGTTLPSLQGLPSMPLRLGCHFGECTALEGEAWIGRGINLGKRVESAAEANALFATETVLELIDLPLYEFEVAGAHVLKGDYLPERTLYRVLAVDYTAVEAKPPAELTAEGWLLKGLALIGTERENSDDEAACYREALQRRPDYPEAHNNLAILLRARGDLGGAAEHYREAIHLRPDYPEAHYNYALLLESFGRVTGAIAHYRAALDARPDYVDAHHAYANLLTRRRDLAKARTHYEQALQLRPDAPEAHNNYAILLEDIGERAQAGEHYRRALDVRPDYPEAHYNYALLLEQLDEPAGAEEHYRAALALQPDYAEAHNNLAILLQVRGDAVGAEQHYREALRLRPADPETHYNYGLLLRARGDKRAAEEHFQTAHELAPDIPTFQPAVEPLA